MDNDFIEEYEMSKEIVDGLINFYNENKDAVEDGKIGTGRIDKKVKESKDIVISTTWNEEPFNRYKEKLHSFIVSYANKYDILNTDLKNFGLAECILIQKYPIRGGFKKFHCERTGRFDDSIKRCLVWMTYLNNVDDGGTEFIYQNKTIKAEKGKTIIFPSDWTHTHRGQVSHTKEKMIITGWYSHLWD